MGVTQKNIYIHTYMYIQERQVVAYVCRTGSQLETQTCLIWSNLRSVVSFPLADLIRSNSLEMTGCIDSFTS